MKNSAIVGIVIALILIVVIGFVVINSQLSNNTESSERNKGTVDNLPSAVNGDEGKMADKGTGDNIIEITSSGFSPSTLTVNEGETTVTFINKDSSPHWPASAVHPTHTVYPGSGIQKCGTAEESNIFDACGGLKQGESFSFIFNEKGSWGYHDHLQPSSRGTIVVN